MTASTRTTTCQVAFTGTVNATTTSMAPKADLYLNLSVQAARPGFKIRP